MSQSGLQRYLLGGSEPGRPILVALARAARVSLEWLATGKGSIAGAADRPPEGYVLLPLYNVRAAGGVGELADLERVVDHIAFKLEWIHRRLGTEPSHLLLIEAVGDSMVPTIDDGDLLLVDAAGRGFRDDGIYVIARDEGLSVKRLRRRFDRKLMISSDNPIYGPEEVEIDAVRVVGRVIWAGGKL